MVYNLFDKKTSGRGIKIENISNKCSLDLATRELAEELHKPIIRKFSKRKLKSHFIDNIWGTNLTDMQLISKFSKEFRFLLCVIDLYSKYTWVIPLKIKNKLQLLMLFINFQMNRNTNQIKYGLIKAANSIVDQ